MGKRTNSATSFKAKDTTEPLTQSLGKALDKAFDSSGSVEPLPTMEELSEKYDFGDEDEDKEFFEKPSEEDKKEKEETEEEQNKEDDVKKEEVSQEDNKEEDFEKEPEEKQEPEKKVEDKKVEETEEPKFSEDVLDRAIAMGYTEEDLKEFKSNDELDRSVSLHEKNLIRMAKNNSEFREPVREEKPVKEEPASTTQSDNVEKYQIKLDPKEFEPEVIKEFNNLNEFFSKKIDALTGEIKTLREVNDQHIAEKQQAELIEVFSSVDEFFDGLASDPATGKDYAELFGKGNVDNLNKKSIQFLNRKAVLEEVNILANGYQHARGTVPPLKSLLMKATKNFAGDKFKQIAEKEVKNEIVKRSKQITNRPTQKKGNPFKEKNREEVARENYISKLKEKGIDVVDDFEDIDGF